MAIKGGYQIINLNKIPFITGGNSETCPGIFKLIEKTKKAFLISGLVVNNEEYNDTFVDIIRDDTDQFIFTIRNFDVYVESDDSVSVEYHE